jgi:AmmeMemoRadiSam system protein A
MARSHSTSEAALSKAQMQVLLLVARDAIARKLEGKQRPSEKELEALAGKDAQALLKKRGAFVTLTIGGGLRGCIGSILAGAPLLWAVHDNALNAAFCDPRFAPLSKDEFKETAIEVSVLSPLCALEYSDASDLLSKLKPRVHGVLLRFPGGAGATFLPQVWEQLPKKEDFLSHLCAKAGMPKDCWRTLRPRVLVYSVQSAEEARPEPSFR